MFLTYRFDF